MFGGLKGFSNSLIYTGECIKNIRYPDESVIIDKLQTLMKKFITFSEKCKLTLNIKKAKFRIILKV